MPFIHAIAALWIVFYSYWLISATRAKKAIRATPWWKGVGLRLLVVLAAPAVTRLFHPHHILFRHPSGVAINFGGLALCVAGLALAVWARINLGRNWGTPMSLKAGHELVTTGPYRYIRHPIYTGILLALIGTSCVAGAFWLVILLVFCPYFIYSARTEEQLMMQTFPNDYAAYRKRTSAIIPSVW
jgi:protein-S-isoprenylcysteine O-methyltransferase Ste14